MSSDNFDNQFNDIVNEFNNVEPLSTVAILDGLRALVEANLYINDYLAEFFGTMQAAAEEMLSEEESEDGSITEDFEEIILDLPGFSHECTMHLTLLFNAAKSFCEAITREMED